MARTSIIEREKRRKETVKKYAAKRSKLKEAVVDMSLSQDEREKAQRQLQSLPRDASPSRLRNRCSITGKPRGVYRKFGLSRNMLRIYAMRGDVPGLVKASW